MIQSPTFLNFAFLEQPAKESATQERRLRLQEIRDGHAALLLASALGAHCCGVFIDNPYPVGCSQEDQERDIRRSCLGITTILLSTRPPLNDAADRRRIKRSGNWLEMKILSELAAIFKWCDRKTIELSPDRINQPDPRKMKFHFQQSDEAYVVPRRPSSRGSSGSPREWTVAYFIRLGPLWEGGPGLVCAFGLSGPLTLTWCYLLANNKRCAERLRSNCNPRLLVARIRLDGPIPCEPHFLSFVDNWDVDFLIDQELGEPQHASHAP